MRSFDELIEFLLDEVALCGEKGESIMNNILCKPESSSCGYLSIFHFGLVNFQLLNKLFELSSVELIAQEIFVWILITIMSNRYKRFRLSKLCTKVLRVRCD